MSSDKQVDPLTAQNSLVTKQVPITKGKPGAKWRHNEQHVLPKNRLPLVFLGLCLTVFLAAIDQVLVLCSCTYKIGD